MAGFSTSLSNDLLDHVNGVASYTAPATLYVALFDTSSSLSDLDAGTITGEIAGTGYSRATITFDAATSSATSNATEASFTATDDDWGTIRFAAVMDADTGGNVLYYGQLNADRDLVSGDSLTFAVGDFDVSLDA